jgi:hypothetical protein
VWTTVEVIMENYRRSATNVVIIALLCVAALGTLFFLIEMSASVLG